MADKASSLLKQLDRLKDAYGGAAGSRKLDLLLKLEHHRLRRARELFRLHELLCFLRAYPDTKELLARVERMLARFADRDDLRRHRKALADTGIAGTSILFPFFWFTARWLARRWPDRLSIDWANFEKKRRLEEILHLLVPYSETPALDELSFPPREWINRLKGPTETDAAFLIRRFETVRADSFGREKLYEDLDIPIRLAPGPNTPARTRTKYLKAPVVFQVRPLSRSRPSLRRAINRAPPAVRPLPPREARKLIDLAREAMVTRRRDLDVFEHADKHDVRMVDCGEGLQFACIGAMPERRLMLEAVYGFLALKNGVPIGYVLTGALFRSAEIAYNVFESYRGAEAAFSYGRVLAMVRRLFASDTFTIAPYQLGYDNPEALQTGAWWFYYKLGFRPRDPRVRRVLRAELDRIKTNPRHRSSIATLKELAAESIYLYLRRPRKDVLGRLSLGNVGLRVTRYIADRFGADREAATRTCSREAARLLGLRSLRAFSAGERLAWERWSPLIMTLPGVERWNRGEKQALVRVVRAKGGRRESDFVALFDRHRRLRDAIAKLAEEV
ncbi:MAG: hypothetical protein ACE5JN_12570 [Candidatus Methylomirabilia bacterium]